jgi:hypothetical protein
LLTSWEEKNFKNHVFSSNLNFQFRYSKPLSDKTMD